jgi:uncharacterized protein (DUF305 family)
MVRRSVVCLLAVAFVAACGQAAPAPGPAAPPAGVAPAPASTFNGTDTAWLQLMIPMTEQALRLLDLPTMRTASPAMKKLAADVEADYRTELIKLRELQTRSAIPATNIHEGHDMPGLMTADDLAAAGQAHGADVNRLVSSRLQEQFAQSVLLCQGVRTSGSDKAVRSLATAIERARTAQLAELG